MIEITVKLTGWVSLAAITVTGLVFIAISAIQ